MAAYVESIPRAPRTLTDREQRALLRVTGEHRAGFRDHLLYSMALATGLRAHELVALDVGDVFDAAGRPRLRIQLRVFKGDGRGVDDEQEVLLSDALRSKLGRLRRWKEQRGGFSPCLPPGKKPSWATIVSPALARKDPTCTKTSSAFSPRSWSSAGDRRFSASSPR